MRIQSCNCWVLSSVDFLFDIVGDCQRGHDTPIASLPILLQEARLDTLSGLCNMCFYQQRRLVQFDNVDKFFVAGMVIQHLIHRCKVWCIKSTSDQDIESSWQSSILEMVYRGSIRKGLSPSVTCLNPLTQCETWVT